MPAAIGHPSGQHLSAQVTARSGEQPRAHIALLRQGFARRIVTGLAVPTNVGRAPSDVLADISNDAHALQLRHAAAWTDLVRPALADAGIEITEWDVLSDAERAGLTLDPARKAYVHLARGRLTVSGHALNAGDALAIDGETALSLHDGQDAEVLVFELQP